MRLARIAHPDGVAFAAVDGPDGAEQRAREIAGPTMEEVHSVMGLSPRS